MLKEGANPFASLAWSPDIQGRHGVPPLPEKGIGITRKKA